MLCVLKHRRKKNIEGMSKNSFVNDLRKCFLAYKVFI